MVDLETLQRLALALPEASGGIGPGQIGFGVGGKGFAWSFKERIHPKKPRVERRDLLAVRCAMETKEMLLEAAPDRFFDDAHYRNFPAVLIRLNLIEEDELAGLLQTAWRLMAPKALLKRVDGAEG